MKLIKKIIEGKQGVTIMAQTVFLYIAHYFHRVCVCLLRHFLWLRSRCCFVIVCVRVVTHTHTHTKKENR